MKNFFQWMKTRIQAASKKIRIKTMIKYFTLSLTILSLLLSIHTDVFQQDSEKLWATISIPYSTLMEPTPPAIELSTLLHEKTENANDRPATSTPTLYIFVLDVSKSMLNQTVSKEEMEQYLNDLKDPNIYKKNPLPSGFLPKPTRPVTTFDIARAELCRYINSVPDGSDIAIWKLGTNPELIVPSPNKDNDIYVHHGPTPGGGHTKTEIIKSLSKLSAIDNRTNFEKLLQQLSSTYQKEIASKSEVHFIIISDFAHDITDGKDASDLAQNSKDKLEGSIWKSQYRISAVKIAEYFREISKNGGKTFHLAVVSGSRSVMCAILPIAGETLPVYSFRELQLMPSTRVLPIQAAFLGCKSFA